MTWEWLKSETLKLLQEYMDNQSDMTDDEDIINNMIPATNKILNELSRAKKIETYQEMNVEEGQMVDLKTLPNYYQLKTIRFEPEEDNEFDCRPIFEAVGNFVKFKQKGTATIYYYRYPTIIDEDTDDAFQLELDQDALNIAPTGIAGTILMTDISNQYGAVFLNNYEQMLQRLDSRTSDTVVQFKGGI